MRPRARALLFAVALSFAVLPQLAEAQDDRERTTTLTVIGRVVDANTGSPIAGAVVRVGDTRLSTMTDEGGNFALRGVEAGHATLGFEQIGYTSITLTQEFRAGDAPLQVELEPQPVVLEGLKVMADRFEARRQATGFAVRVLDDEDFRSLPTDAFDALRLRGGLSMYSCTPRYSTSTWCVLSRGTVAPPVVVIDDRSSMGLEELQLYRTDELYAIEIYRGGRHIRVYTRHYVARTAMSPRALMPIGY